MTRVRRMLVPVMALALALGAALAAAAVAQARVVKILRRPASTDRYRTCTVVCHMDFRRIRPRCVTIQPTQNAQPASAGQNRRLVVVENG